MPFQRQHDWEFPWEKAPDNGQEFIASISARDARTRWSLALRKAQHNGVLVVLYHDKPVGVMGSPLILLDILRQRRAGTPEQDHRDIEVGLGKAIQFAELRNTKQGEMPATLSTRTINVRARPKSVATLLQQFDVVVVTYRQHQVRAFCLSLPILARAWSDLARSDQLLDWMRDAIRATDEPLWAW